nr:beta-ketoacyl-ACP synthase II [Ardenticatena sp.]
MTSNQLPRIVVTGVGVVTSLGQNVETFWDGLIHGRSGIHRFNHFDASEWPVQIGGYIDDFDPTRYISEKEARRMARFTQLALAATEEALADSGIDLSQYDPTRIGIEMGNAVGDLDTITKEYEVMKKKGPRRIRPHAGPSVLINMGACQLAIRYGIQGPAGAPVAACATGLYAVGDAMRRIQRGEADIIIAGSSEALLTPLAVAAFWRIQALSTRNDEPEKACRPFDKDRDGTVMSEGAATLILEREDIARARGARIYAEVVGYGVSVDGFHLIAPDPQGRGAARAMAYALREAGIAPEEVDWISAHGTGTPLNDLSETLAIKSVFGEAAHNVPVSSIKSMVGHTLGAAGTVSLVANIKAIETGIIPPTINLDQPDPQCDLDYVPNEAREARVDVAMSNAFGFGGQNACVIVRRYEG